MQQAVEDAAAQNPDIGTWEEDWAPIMFSQYVDIDGLGEIYAINFARAFEIDATDNTVVEGDDGYLVPIDMSEASFLPDGYYSTLMWGGLNPDYFLQ